MSANAKLVSPAAREEGRQSAFKEAVEIAREAVRGLDPDESSFDEGAEWARDTIAAAIEAKAGDK